jgi:hypothetical protein
VRITNLLLIILGLALGLGLAVAIVFTAGEAKLLPAIQTLGSVAIAFSATVAFGVYLSTVRRHQQEDARKVSETYLQEALSVLEKSYETFVKMGDSPPANDRLVWLSTARMISRFHELRKKVTELDHVSVIAENEEYIRLKFYILLRENRGSFTRAYFCPSGDQYSEDNISRKSIAVIFAFTKWREDTPDPLDEIDDIELFARGALPVDQNGAEAYLEDFNEYWRKVQERRAAIESKKT